MTSTLTVSTRLSEKKALAPGVSVQSWKQDIKSRTVFSLSGGERKSRLHAQKRQSKAIESITTVDFLIFVALLFQVEIETGIRSWNE